MLLKKKGKIVWLEFALLQPFPHVRHGVFLRSGGMSRGDFSSLNVAFGKGDDEEAVIENRQRIAACLGFPKLLSVEQVHSTHITNHPHQPADGLYTSKRGEGLLIHHADCQAAIFFDPVQNVVANIHCGWRGSVQNIYQKAVDKLRQEFGSKPKDLLVCISPSLGPDAAEFIHYVDELPQEFWQYRKGECHFDFWAIAVAQLQACGVDRSHIEVAKICTFFEDKRFFSFRRDKKTGRNATVVGLCDESRIACDHWIKHV